MEAVAGRILERWAGERISLGAPIVRLARETTRPAARAPGPGGVRARARRARGAWLDLAACSAREVAALRKSALLLVDRLALRRDAGRARLAEAVATAFARGQGHCVVVTQTGERASYREGFACDGCGRSFATPEPALFSFNSPLGACEACQGFGRVPALDRERVIPDPDKSLEEGAIAPFTTPRGQRWQRHLLRACRELGVPTDRPVAELSAAEQRLDLRRRRRLARRQGLLRAPRAQALQGAGARA